MFAERDTIINYLLKASDDKNVIIQQLQAKIAEYEKKEATVAETPKQS